MQWATWQHTTEIKENCVEKVVLTFNKNKGRGRERRTKTSGKQYRIQSMFWWQVEASTTYLVRLLLCSPSMCYNEKSTQPGTNIKKNYDSHFIMKAMSVFSHSLTVSLSLSLFLSLCFNCPLPLSLFHTHTHTHTYTYTHALISLGHILQVTEKGEWKLSKMSNVKSHYIDKQSGLTKT